MKKIIIIILMLSLILVACGNDKVAENKANINPVEEVIEVPALSLRDMDAVKIFIETDMVDTFKLSELYRTFFLDLDDDGLEELFIINDVFGPVACLTLEGDAFKAIPCEISADVYGSLVKDGEFILLEKNISDAFGYKVSKTPFLIADEGILAFESGEIVLEYKRVVDPILMTYEILTSTLEQKEAWFNFSVENTVTYMDEKGLVHDYKHYTDKYLTYKATRSYDITTEEDNTYPALSALYEDLKVYGTDSSLKTFEKVYEEGDLEAAVHYFHENRLNFVKGDREAFANAIISKILLMQDYYLDPLFDDFDHVEITEGDKGLSVFFTRNDGQQHPKNQGILAFFKKYALSEGAVEDAGLVVAFKNQALSNEIYEVILDADLRFDRGRVKNYMIHAEGYDAFMNSPVSLPNVMIGSVGDTEAFLSQKKSSLLVPLELLNEPLEFININHLKQGKYVGDMKIHYLSLEGTQFNINLTGTFPIDGLLKYDTKNMTYYVDIEQEAKAVLYFDFPSDQFRSNVLSGMNHILNDEAELLKMVGETAMEEAKKGNGVPVSGTVRLILVSAFEQISENIDNIDLKELYLPE